MALIKCSECGRDISDKAEACPGCGAPVTVSQPPPLPLDVHYDRATDTFTGTMALMVKLAMRAVQKLGWKLDTANEALGLVTFQTAGMSFASWSGVSCSLTIEEVSPNTFRVSGVGKQNIRGDQLLALDLFGEAGSKARKAIEMMKVLVEDEKTRKLEIGRIAFLLIISGMIVAAYLSHKTTVTSDTEQAATTVASPPKLAEPVTAPPPAPVHKDHPPPAQRIWISPQ
jgi:hypothetical protein